MTPSRRGPRKPGQTAAVFVAVGSLLARTATGSTETLVATGAGIAAGSGALSAAVAGGVTVGLSVSWARSRSSAVGAQRHARSETASALKPLVRRSAHAPHASRMVATMVARRTPFER